ncbi:DUF2892 domain-containing protein [Cognatishimia sp. WU-CL00825]|uniref:YgaP family membrane protein n=1 Tax=Cognatishimia sp. WU-CL00825 TaxID=3127658 RepID=UPI0031073410
MFARNIGSTDKTLRIVVGLLLIVAALYGYGAWMWIGVVPLATGLLNTCPAYSILGIKTCQTK